MLWNSSIVTTGFCNRCNKSVFHGRNYRDFDKSILVIRTESLDEL